MTDLFNNLIEMVSFGTIDIASGYQTIDNVYLVISGFIWYAFVYRIPKKLLRSGK